MSRLKQLIQELCPDGVEFYSLGELELLGKIQLGRGNIISKKDMQECPGDYPVYSSAATNNGMIGKYGKYMFEDERLSWSIDGGGRFFYRNNEKYSITNVGGWLKVLDDSAFLTRYLYHVLSAEWSKKTFDYIHKAHPSVIRDEYVIPIPPIEVQREIVRILDNFTELTAELTAELELRKKQYSELSYQLLIKKNNSKLHFVKDLCELSKGKTPIQKAEPGDYPLVVTTSERKSCKTYQYDTAAVCIPLVSSRGHGVASLNHVYYQEGKFALGNILCAVVPTDENVLSAKYLYFYFECTKDYTLVPLMKGGANVSMRIPDIEKVKIPVPDIETQHNIVSKLEILDEYCNITLSAEIEANKKRYEYYRDKLLDFKEVK